MAEILPWAPAGGKCTLQIMPGRCKSLHVHVGTRTPAHKRYTQLDLGNREKAQRKKKDWQTSFCCFYVFSATAKQVPAATCLYFSVENNKVYGNKTKTKTKNVSFNSSSAAESSWSIRLCVPLISKRYLSQKTSSCQLHSPKCFQNVRFEVRHFENCIDSSENTFKRETLWLYFRKFSDFKGILFWEGFLYYSYTMSWHLKQIFFL